MKLSDIITHARDAIQDPVASSSQKWNDKELTRYANMAQNYMFRWQCEMDSSYHNLEYDLSSGAARQLHANIYAFDLPRWAYRVTRVQETKGSTDAAGKIYMPSSDLYEEEGWRWDGAHRFRLNTGGGAPNVTVSVCKIPARLHTGTCPADGGAATLLSPNLPSLGPGEFSYENEVDAYANSIVEMTGVADGSRDPVGQIGRVINSSRVGSGSNYRIQFTMSSDWAEIPDTNDTYEMHPEVDEAHTRFLILLMAQYAYQKYNNVGGLQAIRMEFMDERKRFIDSCSPRDDGQPKFWANPWDRTFSSDPDQDLYLKW